MYMYFLYFGLQISTARLCFILESFLMCLACTMT